MKLIHIKFMFLMTRAMYVVMSYKVAEGSTSAKLVHKELEQFMKELGERIDNPGAFPNDQYD